MKIVSLKAENVKRLVAVEIKPDGNMVVIGGKNGAGKSSVLDSIMYALGGKSAVAKQPIRNGQESASVELVLDDLIVTRKWTEKGSYLTVANKDGAKYSSGQAMLDKLVGRLSFDPLGFSRMKGAEQAATLRDLVGIDHSELDAKRKAIFDERTAVNREAKRLSGAVDSLPAYPDAPAEEVSVAGLMEELKASQQVNAAKADKEDELESYKRVLNATIVDEQEDRDDIQRLEHALRDAKESLARAIKAREEAEAMVKKAEAEYDEMPEVDCDPIHERISKADEVNSAVRANAERAKLKAEYTERVTEADTLTEQLKVIDEQKAGELAAAQFPLDGLSFDGDVVSLNGVPFEQASSAEQLRASVAIGLAMNPELRVVLIRDASLMDEDSLALVAEMAAEKDAQLWIERVGEGDECSIVIEDGMVKTAELVSQP